MLVDDCRAKTPESSASNSETAMKEGATATTAESQAMATAALPDGVHTARFETGNSIFHMSEMMRDHGVLTIRDGKMTLHVPLQSKRILNLSPRARRGCQRERCHALAASNRHGRV